MSLLFVFGTFKQGFPDAVQTRGQRLRGDYQTCESYPLYLVGEGHVPWLMDLPGEGVPVMGQLFRVDDADLLALDEEMKAAGAHRAHLLVRDAAGQEDEPWLAFAYLRPAALLDGVVLRQGPFADYTLALSRRYRRVRPA